MTAPVKSVILDHDGGDDDVIALALLLANPGKVKVIGSIVTDGDCFVDHAFSVSGKIMAMMAVEESVPTFPIGRSSLKAVNPFPTDWRWHAKNLDDFPSINLPAHAKIWEALKEENMKYVGEQLLADLVMKSPEKVTICVTGPLCNVAWCIDKYGEAFCRNVEEVVIMGGAVDVRGNVFITDRTDGTAEWNIFWDPQSAKTVLTCPHIRNVLFSLDSTNSVPVNSAVVQKFGAQNNYLLSQFVGSSWATCTHFDLMRPGDGYYAWDVLTAAYAINPNLAEVEPISLDVVVDACPSEGRTVRNPTGTVETFVAKNTNAQLFYDMVFESMKKCPVNKSS